MSKINQYNLPNSEIAASGKFAADNRIVISKTDIGATSSSTSITALYNIFIPANTFVADDILELKTIISKTGIRGGATIKFYWNEIPNLVETPIQLGTVTYPAVFGGNAFVTFPMFRRLAISVANGTGRGTIIFNTGTSASNDIHFSFTNQISNNYYSTGGVQNIAINWTINSYILVAGQTTDVADYIQCRYMKLNN